MKNKWLEALASVKLTLVCIGLSMVLVLVGTLAQVHMGTFAAQKKYFNSWWIYPAFPGGLSVGMLWMVNLVAAFATRFQFKKKEAGILLSHFGIILLMAGQFFTQMLSHESHMAIEIGHTQNYSESPRETELALVMTSDPAKDQVTSIPYPLFSREGPVALAGAPFSITIRSFYPNSKLMRSASPSSVATQGVGTRITVEEMPPTSSDDDSNTVTAYVDISEGGKSLGTWLLSSALGAPQSFQAGGKTYTLSIRLKRHYYPFSLTLLDFRHDSYPGTDIPKNFSSQVRLVHRQTGESREALIYMNHPLRYEGKTFYQASFGKDDRLSVFQVVENPAVWVPYLSCLLVAFGLAVQFLFHWFEFMRKRA